MAQVGAQGGQVSDVVLLPSLGRPASDFDALASLLEADGHRSLALDPLDDAAGQPTLHDLADLVIEHVDSAALGRFHLVGHAFGNRLARMVAADHPGRVATLTLLAAGGHLEMDPDVARSLMACFDESLTATDHLRHVARAFFARGNDPRVWAEGWMPVVAAYQSAAVQRTPTADWWNATAERVLVVQAPQDVIAPSANGRRYLEDHRDVAVLVEIDGAGHALIAEQPQTVADALLAFLDR